MLSIFGREEEGDAKRTPHYFRTAHFKPGESILKNEVLASNISSFYILAGIKCSVTGLFKASVVLLKI